MPFQGLLDVSQWDGTEERPEDWLELLFLILPNGDTPLAALSGMMPSENVTDIEFNWYEKSAHANQLVSASAAGTGSTLTVNDATDTTAAARSARPGNILLHDTSGEHILVLSVDSTAQLTVQRNWNGVGAATIGDGDTLTILTAAHETGSRLPSQVFEAPTKKYNCTQIFKQTLEETRTALQTATRPHPRGNYDELKRSALERYAFSVEMSILFGRRVAPTTGPGGRLLYTTGGFTDTNFMPAANIKAVNGALPKDTFDGYMRDMFLYGGRERVVPCGGTYMTFVQQYLEGQTVRMAGPNEALERYRLKVYTWESVWGDVHFLLHPWLRQHSVFTKDAIFIDFDGCKRRTMQPTRFLTNAQDRDEDLRRDGYLGEFGWQIPKGIRNSWHRGVTAYGG